MDSYLKWILTSGILILSLIIYWYYKYFIASYSKFPSYRLDFRIIYWLLTGKYPRHIPFTSFVFQKMDVALRKHFSEGLCVVWLLQPLLFIFSEESVKIFSQAEEAIDKSFMYKVLEDGFGTGLVTSNGDTWKARRKMFNPAFRLGMLKNYIPIFNKHAAAMVKNLTDAVKKPSVEMEEHIFCCALNIICESVAVLNIEENSKEIHEFHLLVEKLTRFTTYRWFHPYLRWKFMLKFSPIGRRHLKDYEHAHNITRKIAMRLKETMMKTQVINNSDAISDSFIQKSFGYMLIKNHMTDPSFTVEDVMDELITFIASGYDTVSVSLVWCIFMLGLHQDIQEKVYGEIKSLADKDVTYNDLIQLTYLDCVIKETMRIYPAVPIHVRHLKNDIKCGKYEVPKGTNIVFFPYMYHRNPELYQDPERFDPERFMEGNSDKRSWTHIAFSEGLRNCIGKKFALLEMKVILVHILNKFKILSLDRREDINLDWIVTLRTVKPLRTKLSLRQ